VRFELAYDTDAIPAHLHYRGFQSETMIPLKGAEPERDLKPETETDTGKQVLVKVIELAKGETFGITLEESAEGIRINFVRSDSAADKSGITVGDVVESVDGKVNKNAMALLKVIGAISRGKRERVVLMIRRGSESHRLTVTAK
jgi:C-terminal processing protease CtpA/Prc